MEVLDSIHPTPRVRYCHRYGVDRMSRVSKLRSMASAVTAVTAELQPPTLLAAIQRAWPSVVGSTIAGMASPVGERAGVVTVACNTATWAQELDLMSEQLIHGLNGELGRDAVTRIRPQATQSPDLIPSV